ncbi:MAG TPA: phosphoribosylformylglycinamidine cyclo-ligase [Rhizobiales bacterium]|nr:phosphoribosylformylglycinamidine cyclo-ligase [Hyphomicrobiales bacterium]
MAQNSKSITYADAGVNIDQANRTKQRIKYLAHKTFTKGVLSEIGGFGALFAIDKTKYLDPILVSSVDGVGTKLKLAFEMKVHHTIGADLVNHCVNDIAMQGAAPMFFMDYLATGRLQPEVAEKVIEGLADACKHNGCALIGGETAEMPGLYAPGDYDLAGFAVGAVERSSLLPRKDLEFGDVILALPSSGVHANGFSLVRRLVEQSGLRLSDPAPFAPGKTLGEALLTPTRIYVRQILETIRTTGAVKALAHITGGGLTDNIPRVLPADLAAEIDLVACTLPPVFAWLQREARMDQDEMLRTFNCGIGMIVVVAASDVERVLRHLGEETRLIGALVGRGGGDAIRFKGELAWGAR